jgi:hypothetical protein
MEDNTDDRIAAIEDKVFALCALAMHTFQGVFPRGPERNLARSQLISVAESFFGDPALPKSDAMHLRLQRVLGYLEDWTG